MTSAHHVALWQRPMVPRTLLYMCPPCCAIVSCHDSDFFKYNARCLLSRGHDDGLFASNDIAYDNNSRH